MSISRSYLGHYPFLPVPIVASYVTGYILLECKMQKEPNKVRNNGRDSISMMTDDELQRSGGIHCHEREIYVGLQYGFID